jgi:transcriptional regulator with XRE-family HTH domain
MCESTNMDYAQLASELVRGVRGRRSQQTVSRRLGFRSNVVYAWESGRSDPTAAEFLRFAESCRVAVRPALSGFYVRAPAWLGSVKLVTSPAAVASFLRDQRGRTPIVELAAATGISRFALSRWFKGTAEPRLPDFLHVLHAATQRVGDWIAPFADPAGLPSLARLWQSQQAARRAAYELPWTQPVSRALELAEYQALPTHRDGWIAARLGLDPDLERQALETLALSGQITQRAGRWCVDEAAPVDLRVDPEAAARQRAFWVGVAAERAEHVKGMFAYNVCAVSERDLLRLKQLAREFLQQARTVIAQSSPVERVALIQMQLFALDDPADAVPVSAKDGDG